MKLWPSITNAQTDDKATFVTMTGTNTARENPATYMMDTAMVTADTTKTGTEMVDTATSTMTADMMMTNMTIDFSKAETGATKDIAAAIVNF